MLKTIVQHSQAIISFLSELGLALYQPQQRHLIRLLDALLVSQGQKTLSDLYRLIVDAPGPKAVADYFRESPWKAKELNRTRKQFMLMKFLEVAQKMGLDFQIWVSIDDSLGKKGKATRKMDVVDYYHNHTESSKRRQVYTNGYEYVEVHVQIGSFGFLYDTALYLREKKVRQLNRGRAPEQRLHFRTKYLLARGLLVELAEQLPKGHQVYVLFDSWYASARLIKFCRRQGWHVICAVKSNRRIDKKCIDQHDQALKHKRHQKIMLETRDPKRKAPTYFVRQVQGHLEEVAKPVLALISKKRPGDKRPKYFICTDLKLSAQKALRYYQKRWSVEVDNQYLKDMLGLGDFRVRSFQAAEKWFAVVVLALNYLQYQVVQHYLQTQTTLPLADFIRLHRLEHFQMLLRSVVAEAQSGMEVDAVLEKYLPAVSDLFT